MRRPLLNRAVTKRFEDAGHHEYMHLEIATLL